MYNKQMISKLSKRLSLDYKETSALALAVGTAIGDLLCEGDSLAIPGFGRFAPKKEDEAIVKDLSTGRRLLLPPHISVEFAVSSLLTKRLTNNG